MITYEEIKKQYDNIFADQASLLNEKKQLKAKIKTVKEKIIDYTDSRALLNDAIKIVHQKFKDKIERIITNAVQKVFNRNLKFELRYEEKRNSIESKIVIKEDGFEIDSKDDLGGSLIDIISFAFRIVLWYISSPKSRNTFILDEPFKWTGKLITLTGMVMKELATELKFQVIMITHDDELIQIADKIFKVDHINGISKVTVIRGRSYVKDKMSNLRSKK